MRRAGGRLARALAATAAQQEHGIAAAAAAAGGTLRLLAAGNGHSLASPLWRLESPLLRHLSTSGAFHAASAAASQPNAAPAPPLPPYEAIKARAAAVEASEGAREPAVSLTPSEADRFHRLLRSYEASADAKDQALALYVNSKLYVEACRAFREWLLAGMDSELRDGLLALEEAMAGSGRGGGGTAGAAAAAAAAELFPYFAEFVLERYTKEIKEYRDIVKHVDMRNPGQWFPVARSLSRKIIYHAGPTNSGKTYNALQAMQSAKSGVYCGPLRLLAMEVYDTCNAGGVYCNLITGQERREVPGASHVSCTVEMVNMQKRLEVAVIDEIQMIGDESRGWAWTRALMGAPANEVHVCGDGSAVPLVRQICEEMGEPFELRTYDRFTTLNVEQGGLPNGYKDVQPGDCVVAFSRRDIYAIKQLIEQETEHRACVVYGALPPETRRTQARLFNETDNQYRVLVASDAVGMGLNLNIRRVIFHSMMKYDGGGKMAPVSVSMVKQIAGRAGRRSSQWQHGLATCASPADVARLQAALDVPLSDLATPRGGLFPEYEHLEVFAGQRPDEPFKSLLGAFEQEALLDSSYFFCRQDSVLKAAELLERVPLGIRDMYSFCMAPASATDLRLGAALLHFAAKYARGQPVTLDISPPKRLPTNVDELKHMEAAHQVVMLWLWLSYRFDEEAFPDRQKVEALAEELCRLLDRGLHRVTRRSKQGVDISEAPASREMETILEAFSDETAALEEEQRKERAVAKKAFFAAAAAERRREKLAARAAKAGLSDIDLAAVVAGGTADRSGGVGSGSTGSSRALDRAAVIAGLRAQEGEGGGRGRSSRSGGSGSGGASTSSRRQALDGAAFGRDTQAPEGEGGSSGSNGRGGSGGRRQAQLARQQRREQRKRQREATARSSHADESTGVASRPAKGGGGGGSREQLEWAPAAAGTEHRAAGAESSGGSAASGDAGGKQTWRQRVAAAAAKLVKSVSGGS